MNIINSRQDIERLTAPEKSAFLSRLAATIYQRDAAGNILTDATAIERFGYALEDFPDAPVADYAPPIVTPPKPAAALALEEAEKSGIEIPFGVGSVRMLCDDRSRALFSSALALYRTHEDLLPDDEAKEAFRNSTVTFADAEGHPHLLTVTQARQLLVVYGASYQAIWAASASAK